MFANHVFCNTYPFHTMSECILLSSSLFPCRQQSFAVPGQCPMASLHEAECAWICSGLHNSIGKFVLNIIRATKSWSQGANIFQICLLKSTDSEVFCIFTASSHCLMTIYTECYLEHSLMNISARSTVKYPTTHSMTQYANQLWDVRGLLGLTLHRFRLF